MGNITHVYVADIFKTEKDANGDLHVFGKAAGPELDADGQICDPGWLAKAMPRWYEWGNVRAQHQPIAAGVGIELSDIGAGQWNLKSHVVDKDTIEKVDKKVYKGYSIGIKGARTIKDAKAPKGRIVDGEIVEISLVDRPSNPTTVLSICKSSGGGMVPVDAAGVVLYQADAGLVTKVLSGDVHKALAQLAAEDAAELAAVTIEQLCDELIEQAELLKSAIGDEGTADVAGLVETAAAIASFVDDGDEAQVDVLAEAQRRAGLTKAAGGSSNASATVSGAEITKAVAEATEPLKATIATLQADVAKAMAAPRSGGPVLLTQPTAHRGESSGDADRLNAIASKPYVSPAIAEAYRQAALEAGATA